MGAFSLLDLCESLSTAGFTILSGYAFSAIPVVVRYGIVQLDSYKVFMLLGVVSTLAVAAMVRPRSVLTKREVQAIDWSIWRRS